MSIAEQMPFLSEAPGYSGRGKAEGWTRELYSRPIISAIDISIVNLKEVPYVIDKESIGHVKRNRRIKGRRGAQGGHVGQGARGPRSRCQGLGARPPGARGRSQGAGCS